VIRRGFWFAAGALAGIAGYRRASRAVRTLLPQADLLAPLGRRIAGQTTRRALGPAARRQDLSGANGMVRRGSGPGQAGAGQLGPSQKRISGTAAFVRDVRTGMADYLDQRRGI
jgi:hypothetical protein